MNLRIIFFLFLIVSCGQKPVENMLLPADQSTQEEKDILGAAVGKIQNDFDAIGVNINLNSIPYHVTSALPSHVAGICVYKENGEPTGIAINRRVMHEWTIESRSYYGLLYKTLLHEIGHCFFDRDHDDGHLMISDNLLSENRFDFSVMISGGVANTPKILWPYYIKEVAGLDRISCLEELQSFLLNSGP